MRFIVYYWAHNQGSTGGPVTFEEAATPTEAIEQAVESDEFSGAVDFRYGVLGAYPVDRHDENSVLVESADYVPDYIEDVWDHGERLAARWQEAMG